MGSSVTVPLWLHVHKRKILSAMTVQSNFLTLMYYNFTSFSYLLSLSFFFSLSALSCHSLYFFSLLSPSVFRLSLFLLQLLPSTINSDTISPSQLQLLARQRLKKLVSHKKQELQHHACIHTQTAALYTFIPLSLASFPVLEKRPGNEANCSQPPHSVFCFSLIT